MKTLYINLNGEQVCLSDELIVLPHRLDIDILFYLAEKITFGSNVNEELSTITEFNTPENEVEYKKITKQIDELKDILLNGNIKDCFEFKLPEKYLNWLNYHPNFNTVYNKNFSNGRNSVIFIDLDDLYDNSIKCLQEKILVELSYKNLYKEINEIVFNDNSVKNSSSIIININETLKDIAFITFEQYKKREIKKKQIKEEEERLVRIEKERLEKELRLRQQQERNLKKELEKRCWLENPDIQSEEEFFYYQFVLKKIYFVLPQKQILKSIRYFLDNTNKNIAIPIENNNPNSPFYKGEFIIKISNKDKGRLKLFKKLCELSRGINEEIMKELFDCIFSKYICDGTYTIKIPSIGGYNGKTKSYLETLWDIKVLKDDSLIIKRIF